MSHILAIDGGGTKTQVLLATQQGDILAEGLGGSTNLESVSHDQALENMRQAVMQAVGDKQSELTELTILMGLAGVDTEEGVQEAKDLFERVFADLHPKKISVVSDVETALVSGSLSPNAVALIAGTGSNCYGRNSQDQIAKASGQGHLLADEGSGYAIGLAALHMATKSSDGRIPHSLLEEQILKHFQVNDFMALQNLIYTPHLTKPQIAQLAPEVEQAAEAGDAAALTIIAQAIAEWLDMVRSVLRRLGLETTPTDLVLVGGLTKVPILFEKFALDVKDHFPLVTIIRPEKPPVYGALAMALHSNEPPATA